MSSEQKKEHFITCSVIKKSSDKTVIVMIERQLRHPAYEKYITRSSKLHVHDEANEAQVGDLVKIIACPRKSKTKAWHLVEILKRVSDDPVGEPSQKLGAEIES